MEPSRRGYDCSTRLALLLLLLPYIFIRSGSIQLPKSTIYNTTIDGKQFTTFYFTDFDKQQLQQPGILMLSSNSSISQGALQTLLHNPLSQTTHHSRFWSNRL
ncbi:unnamed protein product [Urochloa humidicola]